MLPHQPYEVIIVGAGPAGAAAAMVLARSHRRILVFDDGKPRNKLSHGIHNYLTRDGILPADFASITRKELETYNVHIIPRRITKASQVANMLFTLTDEYGEQYQCTRLLVATGVTDIIPDIPGMHELWGNGVYHCPYCDGWNLHDKTVGLYAHRFNGYGMALALRQLSGRVVLFTDTARYLTVAQRAHLTNVDIDIIQGKIDKLSCSNDKLTCVQLASGDSIACDVLFTHNGVTYNNELVKQLGGRCNKSGAIFTNRRQQCNVPGVYVAGDTVFDMQFVTVAAAEGIKAAVSINNSLLQEHNARTIALISSVAPAS